MNDEVCRLVADRLLSGVELYLPEVGTLTVVQRGAVRVSAREFESPCKVVAFSSEKRGVSLVDEIQSAAQCDLPRAEEIYNEWRGAMTSAEGKLEIKWVGTLASKAFVLDEAFDALLNPQGHRLIVRREKRLDWVIWVGVVAIVLASGFLFYQYYYADLKLGVKPVERPRIERCAAQPDSVAASADSVDVAETTVGGTDSASAAPENELRFEVKEKVKAPIHEGIRRLIPGHHYVVVGVFSTIGNAEKAKREALKLNAQLTYRIYYFGELYMVSALESEDRAECLRLSSENRPLFPDMWVYTAK